MSEYILKGDKGYFVENAKDIIKWGIDPKTGKSRYDWSVLLSRYFMEHMRAQDIVPEGFDFHQEAQAFYAYVEGKKFDKEGNEIV